MPRYLILKLDGPMQAWGTHTYEDYRPSNLFPTRSGLLGLLAACLGIGRGDRESLERLAASVEFTVRADATTSRPEAGNVLVERRASKLPDFHTVLEARKVDGKPNPHPVVSRREYLYDAAFTVAVGARAGGSVSLDVLAAAACRPRYTPFLGRRACPIARPLLYERDGGFVEANDAKAALGLVEPAQGTIYTEAEDLANEQRLRLRDVPMRARHRQFGTRLVFIHGDRREA
jgi:CRISPR system Cascade subunit CasD